jgi:hypothetical protein
MCMYIFTYTNIFTNPDLGVVAVREGRKIGCQLTRLYYALVSG